MSKTGVGLAAAATLFGGALLAAAPAQAAVSQSQDGTTCVSDYRNTAGWTNCSGGNGTWKLYVECDWESDHTSGWTTGTGSRSHECTWEVLGANVRWR